MKICLFLAFLMAAPLFPQEEETPNYQAEFYANASQIAPLAYAPEPDAPVVYNPKFGQFSYRTSEQKSYTINIMEVFSPTSAIVKEVQRQNISYYLMVLDLLEMKIYRGTSHSTPTLVDPGETLYPEEDLLFRRR